MSQPPPTSAPISSLASKCPSRAAPRGTSARRGAAAVALRLLRLGGGDCFRVLFVARLFPRAPRPVLRARSCLYARTSSGSDATSTGATTGISSTVGKVTPLSWAFFDGEPFLALPRLAPRRSRATDDDARAAPRGRYGGGHGCARLSTKSRHRRFCGVVRTRARSRRPTTAPADRGGTVSAGPAPAIRAGEAEGAHWGGGGWCAPDGGGRESGLQKRLEVLLVRRMPRAHGWPGTLPQVGGGAPHPGACIGGRGGTPCGEPSSLRSRPVRGHHPSIRHEAASGTRAGVPPGDPRGRVDAPRCASACA